MTQFMARLPKVYQRERDLRAHVLLFVLTLASTVPAASAQLFAARALNDAAFAIGEKQDCVVLEGACIVQDIVFVDVLLDFAREQRTERDIQGFDGRFGNARRWRNDESILRRQALSRRRRRA